MQTTRDLAIAQSMKNNKINYNYNYNYISSLFLLIYCIGCASLETTAYRTTGSIVYTVDKAMSAWGDAVREGQVTANQEFIVKAAYAKYQLALRSERAIMYSYKDNPDKNKLNTAIKALTDASGELVDLIRSFGVAKPTP